VQNVEDTIGEDELFAGGTQTGALSEKTVCRKDFDGRHLRTI
jgi:hypothetical protein